MIICAIGDALCSAFFQISCFLYSKMLLFYWRVSVKYTQEDSKGLNGQTHYGPLKFWVLWHLVSPTIEVKKDFKFFNIVEGLEDTRVETVNDKTHKKRRATCLETFANETETKTWNLKFWSKPCLMTYQ